MPCPFQIFSQLDYLIQVVDINSHTEWQTVQIQISWLLRSQLIWIYTVCKRRIYPGSAGLGLRFLFCFGFPFETNFVCCFTEWFRKENHTTEKYGKPVTTWAICHTKTRGFICRKLGGWLGFHRFNEVSVNYNPADCIYSPKIVCM